MSKKSKKAMKKAKNRGLRKSRPSKGMAIQALMAIAGFGIGNLAANYASKATNEKLVGAVTPLAGILATNFVKLPEEGAIKAGLLISSIVQFKKTDMFPKNDMLNLALSGDESQPTADQYRLAAYNEAPLEGAAAQNEIYVGSNTDPLD